MRSQFLLLISVLALLLVSNCTQPKCGNGQCEPGERIQGQSFCPQDCFVAANETGCCSDPYTGVCINDMTFDDCAAKGSDFSWKGGSCTAQTCTARTGCCYNKMAGQAVEGILRDDCRDSFGTDYLWAEGNCTEEHRTPVKGCCAEAAGVCTENLTRSECAFSWAEGNCSQNQLCSNQAQPVYLKLEPPTINVSRSSSFNVSISFQNVTNLTSMEFYLSFDPILMNFTQLYVTGLASSAASATSDGHLDEPGYLVGWLDLGVESVSGSGPVASLEFKGFVPGSGNLTLYEFYVYSFDAEGNLNEITPQVSGNTTRITVSTAANTRGCCIDEQHRCTENVERLDCARNWHTGNCTVEECRPAGNLSDEIPPIQ